MTGELIASIIWLLFAHFIGDGALQPERYAMKKRLVLRYMINHCFIYTGAISFMLYFLNDYALWKSAFIFCSHLAIDQWLPNSPDPEKTGLDGWVDLALHIGALSVVV